MKDLSRDPLPKAPPRRDHSHKGDFGRALVVGGSLGMAGAPAMAAMACLRSGAGLVSVAAPGVVLPTVASYSPAYMTQPLADDGERISERAAPVLAGLLDAVDAAAIGPGLGRGAAIDALVALAFGDATTPLVVDADGLNALASQAERPAPAGPRVLTPHAGEFARLRGAPLANPDNDDERREAAGDLARALGGEAVVLLKGPRTVVTDGIRFAVNTTGNPGMATGGSGDVLTGVIAALLAQGLGAFDAARLGAYVHGLAGDFAAERLGRVGLIATDLIDHLPEAWRRL